MTSSSLTYICMAVKRTSSYYYTSSYVQITITPTGSTSVSGGIIAAIVICSIIGVIIIVLVIIFLKKKHTERAKVKSNETYQPI